MGVAFRRRAFRRRLLLWPLVLFILIDILFHQFKPVSTHAQSLLIIQHIDNGKGIGGRWYIPPSWLDEVKSRSNVTLVSSREPKSVLQAAELALELSSILGAFASHSKIPLVVHQTWRSLESEKWSQTVRESVDGWLQAAVGVDTPDKPEFAYILWDDDGIDELMKNFEPELFGLFRKLPYPVMKADTFRIAVVKWFGGIYADVDVKLLQHPANFVHQDDLTPWADPWTGNIYGLPKSDAAAGRTSRYEVSLACPSVYRDIMSRFWPPLQEDLVGAIFGIECDTPPDTDQYWRMGYAFPVQLTNWALAMSPQHPTATAFLVQLATEIRSNVTRLADIDPLDLTGPPALTATVKALSEQQEGVSFNWNGMTSLNEKPGGRGKLVAGDVLVLPITGFSPGRGWLHNMGSMPKTDPNARLSHEAQGSWRKTSVKAELGKFCRTVLGTCRDWKKIP